MPPCHHEEAIRPVFPVLKLLTRSNAVSESCFRTAVLLRAAGLPIRNCTEPFRCFLRLTTHPNSCSEGGFGSDR